MDSPEIQRMIQIFSKLPSLGQRSARRIALHILKKKEQILIPLMNCLQDAKEKIRFCNICYNLDTYNPCNICLCPKRDPQILCVVENVSDLWAIERSKIFKGLYHVLGGSLSAIDGVRPEHLTIDSLLERLSNNEFGEVILALNATIDGQTTMHFVTDKIKHLTKKISTLAHGVPVGGELDYLDDNTISIAYNDRHYIFG